MRGKKITKKLVDSLRPAAVTYLVWDTELKGFLVRVTPNGAVSYAFEYRFGKVTRRLTIGGRGDPWTPDSARDEALKLKARVAQGGDPAMERKRFREQPTLREFAREYIEKYAKPRKKPSSWKGDERLLENHILRALGSMRVVDITRADVARFHRSLGEKRVVRERDGDQETRRRVVGGQIVANRAMALLSRMFSLAEAWGVRADNTNPCRHVERFDEQERGREFTADELERLGAALAEAERNGRDWPRHKDTPKGEISAPPVAIWAIRLIALTGLRREEALSLRWEWVDLDRGRLNLPDAKAGARVVPLGGPAARLLSTLPRTGQWVFPSVKELTPEDRARRKMQGHLVGLTRVWHRVRQRAKLPDARIHDLRHLYGSTAGNASETEPMIRKLLGHKSAAMARRYVHIADDPVLAAANRTATSIESALAGKKSAEPIPITPARR